MFEQFKTFSLEGGGEKNTNLNKYLQKCIHSKYEDGKQLGKKGLL